MTEIPPQSIDLLQWFQTRFRQYYSMAKPEIPEINRREFGFGGLEKKIEFRHLSFENPQALWNELRLRAPLYVSCSAAYYEFPSARPMQKKNWLGADLIFDLDAEPDELSPFISQKSLDSIKQKAITLIEDFLIPDFGLSKSELHVNFSGSRGYHVRAYKKEAQKLGRQERRELVDYIEGKGLNPAMFFKSVPNKDNPNISQLHGPTPSTAGYGGKLARKIILASEDRKTFTSLFEKKFTEKTGAKIITAVKSGNYSVLSGSGDDIMTLFSKAIQKISVPLTNQVETDANVTIDTSKILRLPDSIHGGSGLLAKSTDLNSITNFNPLFDALAFKSQKLEKIKILQDIPSMEFANQTFEKLEKEKELDLPEGFAMYLVCKKTAIPI